MTDYEKKQYAQRSAIELDRAGGYYMRHVSAMTGEKLHAKSDIAAELAWRDMTIDRLHTKLAEARADSLEQARLLGISGSVEARLWAEKRADEALLRQALEALEADESKLWPRVSRTSAIVAIRERLGEQPGTSSQSAKPQGCELSLETHY